MLLSTSIATQFGGERQTEQPINLRAGHQGSAEAAYINMAIDAAYKYVYGNGHVMENERSVSLEAELRDQRITVPSTSRVLHNAPLNSTSNICWAVRPMINSRCQSASRFKLPQATMHSWIR